MGNGIYLCWEVVSRMGPYSTFLRCTLDQHRTTYGINIMLLVVIRMGCSKSNFLGRIRMIEWFTWVATCCCKKRKDLNGTLGYTLSIEISFCQSACSSGNKSNAKLRASTNGKVHPSSCRDDNLDKIGPFDCISQDILQCESPRDS